MLRAALLELERLYNHVADIGALCNDVGFGLAQAWALDLREQLLRLNRAGDRASSLCAAAWSSAAHGSARCRPHGELAEIGERFEQLVDLATSSALVMDRFTGAAVLDRAHAVELGVVGVAGRASGLGFDARLAHPSSTLAEAFSPAVQTDGDVLARFRVRVDEVRASLALLCGYVGACAVHSMSSHAPITGGIRRRRRGHRRGVARRHRAPGRGRPTADSLGSRWSTRRS